MNSKINTHIDVDNIINTSIDPSKVKIITLDDQWVVGSTNNSSISYSPLDSTTAALSSENGTYTQVTKSLDLIQALEDVDDIILKFRKRKSSVPLNQEGYKEIMSIYGDIIKDLTYYKDALYNKGKEEKYGKS